MLEVDTARVLLGQGQLAVSLVRPNGAILFENPNARELLGREAMPSNSVRQSLTAPGEWDEIISDVTRGAAVSDRPILLQTPHGNAELYYVTVIPQYDSKGTLDRLLCMWAARRGEVERGKGSANESLDDYTRDLEEVLEHRTYQNLLAAEQNEFARDALDILPFGMLAVSGEGEIIYRNHAMSDRYGFRAGDYVRLDVTHVFDAEIAAAFSEVVATGVRRILHAVDLSGIPAVLQILPLIRVNSVQKVLLVFSRPEDSGDGA